MRNWETKYDLLAWRSILFTSLGLKLWDRPYLELLVRLYELKVDGLRLWTLSLLREQESKAKMGTRWKTFYHLEGLDFYPSMRIVGLEFGTNKLEYIDPSCLVSKFRTAVFGSSITIAQCLNTQLLVPIVNIAL